jgi:hypothetical protein
MSATSATWLGETVVVLTAFALLFGLLYGGWAAILPAVVADLFGNRDVGTIIGCDAEAVCWVGRNES